MNDLLLVNVVVRLEVDALISHVQEPADLNHRQDSLHFELSWEQTFLRKVLDLGQVESQVLLVP